MAGQIIDEVHERYVRDPRIPHAGAPTNTGP